MTDLVDFLPEVMPEVPACPIPVAKNAVRNAIAEFCEKSTVWREDLDPLSILAGVHTYDIDVPLNTRITEIIWAGYNKREIARKTETQFATSDSKWMTSTGTPEAYMQPSAMKIRVYRVPEIALVDGLTLRASLKPDPASDSVNDLIYDDWHETIARGALSRLQSMKKKPWSDAANAGRNMLLFAAGTADAREAARASHHGRVSRVVRYGGL